MDPSARNTTLAQLEAKRSISSVKTLEDIAPLDVAMIASKSIADSLDVLRPSPYFEYEPLSTSRSIRILVLEPNPDLAAPICFQLDEIVAVDQGGYHALSYTWEKQSPSIPVWCDGKPMLITKNCADAIRCLRSNLCQRAQERYYAFWIDAISINQESIEEKNHQVALMSEIYERAYSVFVWTGPCDYSILKILNILSARENVPYRNGDTYELPAKIYEDLFHYFDDLRKLHDLNPLPKPSNSIDLKDFVLHILSDTYDQSYPAFLSYGPLRDFFNRSWFSRMWTLQEIAMTEPHQTCFLLSPEDLLPYALVSMTSMVLGQTIAGSGHRPGFAYDVAYFVSNLQFIIKKFIPDLDASISGLLLDTRLKNCSDLKDKVFALYGMVHSRYPDFPPPNYDKSICEIYTEAISWCIGSERFLNESGQILYLAPRSIYGRRLPELPSWVPDLSQVPTYGNRHFEQGNRYYRSLSGNPHEAFLDLECKASGPSVPRHSFFSNPKLLGLSGVLIDHIIGVGCPFPPQNSLVRNSQNVGLTLVQWGLVLVSCGIDQWRKILNDFLSSSYESINSIHYLDGLKRETTYPAAGILHVAHSINPRLVEHLNRDCYGGRRGEPKVCHYLPEHGLLVTNEKRVGLGMGDIRKGDRVALISGFPIPLILRSLRNGNWNLVGYAYIEGIMHGEAWPRDTSELTKIILE
ncbi:heterokaryon incompatibility protein-domain-containing protein [Leptodontidium sp. MPI-SDFR-AT-0119]|nr:heterokaryon incompatibility protein-domain-containing protein [Leptodontidium sp. MPI-SDFR-AT-0119]